MTFTDIVNEVAEDLNLTSATAITRIGREVNRRYKQIVASEGLETSTRGIVTASTVVGDRTLTFTSTIKLLSVYDNAGMPVVSITRSGSTATATVTAHGYSTGTSILMVGAIQTEYNGQFTITVLTANTFTYSVSGSPATPATGTITVGTAATQRVLDEITFDAMRRQVLGTQPPQQYAVSRIGATSVTIYLDCIPSSVFILFADVEQSMATLAGTDIPAFSENYHDILVEGGKVPELYKMEKPDLAEIAEATYQRRLSDLRFFLAVSAALDIVQGSGPARTGRVINRMV